MSGEEILGFAVGLAITLICGASVLMIILSVERELDRLRKQLARIERELERLR